MISLFVQSGIGISCKCVRNAVRRQCCIDGFHNETKSLPWSLVIFVTLGFSKHDVAQAGCVSFFQSVFNLTEKRMGYLRSGYFSDFAQTSGDPASLHMVWLISVQTIVLVLAVGSVNKVRHVTQVKITS